MGSRISCAHRGSISGQVNQPAPAPARVIAADGSLKELPASPSCRVSDVLCLLGDDAEAATSLLFVCDSDALYFNEHPPALAPGDLLQPGQIYFVLPAAMLERALSAADMAALAVRASAALSSSAGSKPRRRRRGGKERREEEQSYRGGGEDDAFLNEKLNEQTLGVFGVLLSPVPVKGDEKLVAAAAAAAAERARMKRALSIIREDAM